MRVLILGSGGREHALAWKVAQSERVQQVYVAPGNPGTAAEPKVSNVDLDLKNIDAILAFAKQQQIDLTIVGPEAPLAAGIVDQFNEAHYLCFGPTQKAARLESSKKYAKDFMQKYNIPTAAYQTFDEVDAALAYLQKQSYPIVIKASGLAAGKGVVIAETQAEAERAVVDMLSSQRFGQAGQEIVIEEFLTGEEASFIVMADGYNALALATSQDHKTRDDGDLGPNTGGMGAYSPAPVITPQLHQVIMDEVIYPTIRGMQQEGTPYIGFLYAGVMVTKNKQVKVLEFNCRLGDPETQPLMLRLQSDLSELCLAALNKDLASQSIQWDARPALGVVLTSRGYPDDFPKDEVIQGLANITKHNDYKVFHAGTRSRENQVVTAGGRVLCVAALGQNLAAAKALAYEITQQIYWPHIYYRKDIGYRALMRESIKE